MTPYGPPPKYTPWTKGVYDVVPALKALGTDFGNGELDERWFQVDDRWEEFRRSKEAALSECYSKYVHRSNLSEEVEVAAVEAMTARLALEYPEFGATATTLDEFALLVEEDICVVRTVEGKDWLAYLHICSPSHWRASEKIGKPFFDVHTVIPGFDKINRVAPSLVEAMVHKGPFVRFVWGVESDSRANHHPDAPPGQDPAEWDGRDFSKGPFWLRAERQVIWGLPAVGAALFTIKVCHMPGSEVLADPHLRETLVASLESMSPESREYKGLARDWENLMNLVNEARASSPA